MAVTKSLRFKLLITSTVAAIRDFRKKAGFSIFVAYDMNFRNDERRSEKRLFCR